MSPLDSVYFSHLINKNGLNKSNAILKAVQTLDKKHEKNPSGCKVKECFFLLRIAGEKREMGKRKNKFGHVPRVIC